MTIEKRRLSAVKLDGETFQTIMADMVRAGDGIPLPIICRWISDAAEALHDAHNAVSLAGDPIKRRCRRSGNIDARFENSVPRNKLETTGIAAAKRPPATSTCINLTRRSR